MKYNKLVILLSIPLVFASCSAPMSAVTASESQLEVRQIQTREYQDVSMKQAMRASIATLQDLNFILDKVDADLGTISASKLGGIAKVTVTVREKGPGVVLVRANASYGQNTIEEAQIYQDFFIQVDKSLFLVKNQVD